MTTADHAALRTRAHQLLGPQVLVEWSETNAVPSAADLGALDGESFTRGSATVTWYAFSSYDDAMSLARAVWADDEDDRRVVINGSLALVIDTDHDADGVRAIASRFAGDE